MKLSDIDVSNRAVKHGITLMGVDPATFHTSRFAFAREMYELGRQHQREADEVLCCDLAGSSCYDVASDALYRAGEAIRNNTGDQKCQNPK